MLTHNHNHNTFFFYHTSPSHISSFSFFFFNDTATTEIYTLSLHDALPISVGRGLDDLLLAGAPLEQVRKTRSAGELERPVQRAAPDVPVDQQRAVSAVGKRHCQV